MSTESSASSSDFATTSWNKGPPSILAYSDRRGSDRLRPLVERVEESGGATVNLRTGNRPERSDLAALRSLRSLARAVEPDLIHSHSSKAGVLARMLPFFGLQAVQLYHPHAYVGLRPRREKMDFVYNAIERRLGRRSYTVASSSGERDFALQHLKIPPKRLFFLPHGVDTEVFTPAPVEEKRRLREALGLPWPMRILGFMGRSSPQKDPETLYRAFARAAADPSIGLFHVGRGELDPDLDRLTQQLGVGPRIFRCPYLSTPIDFYRAVDGFILTTLYEGFSLAALEALSANLPLILSDAPGNNDLLAEPLSHAWRAPPGNIDAFAHAIGAWAVAVDQPQPINHRQVALERFDSRPRLARLLALYHDLLKTGSQPR